MESKFDTIFESNFNRFQGGGFLTGDVIRLVDNWKNNEWTTKAPQQVVDLLNGIASSDLVLRVSSVKSIRPTVSSTVDQANSVDDFHVDIAQEIAPGRFSGIFVTVPQELIEICGTNDRPPEIPDSMKREEEVDVKPREGDLNHSNATESPVLGDNHGEDLPSKDNKLPGAIAATSYTAGYLS